MKRITNRAIVVLLLWMFFAVAAVQTPVAQAATAREGDQGDRVFAVQLRLIDLGYNVPKATGEFDARTARAVMTYQKQARLNQTGVVDEITWHFLMDYGKGGNYGKKDVARLLNIAMRFGGVPYVWGGETPVGFDCSGFVQYVFRQIGINLPRTADVQYELGRKVLQSELQPGDLVFFETYEPGASHDGIYVGEGNFIAANSGTGVAVVSLSDPYWISRYLGARRLF
jgi:cell wall-associated NlpC family hydrolase